MVQVANMIELGQIQAGLVVGTENAGRWSRPRSPSLNADTSLTRETVKRPWPR